MVGGLQTNASVIQLTGTNNASADSLNNIWVNSGTSTTNSYLIVGNTANTATSGTLGRGSVTLYVDGNAGQPILRFQRQDGYTLLPGQQIVAATGGALTDLSKTYVEIETIGTGVTLNGGTIDLLLGSANAAAGILRVGAVVNNALLNIDAGSTVKVGRLYLGDASGIAGNVNQTGGAVTISDHLRIAHWGSEISTYNLSGGSLTLTNTNPGASPAGAAEQSGGVYVGIDGVGILNQSGGTLTTPWIVLDNRVSTTVSSTINQYNLTGGLVNLTQQFGVKSNNVATGVMTWSAGTLRNAAGAGISVALDVPMTVTGAAAILDTQSADRGFTLKQDVLGGGTITTQGGGVITATHATAQNLDVALAGTSGLDKYGAGVLTLGRVNTYSGPTNVVAGTLNLTGSIANSDLNVAAAGTVRGEGSAKSATFASNSVLVVDPVTAGAFATTGAFTVNATSASKMTISLTSGPANLDPFTVATYGSTNATADLFSVTGATSYRGTPTIFVGDTALTLQLGFGQLTWTGAVNGTFDNATNNFTVGGQAGYFIYGDVVNFDDSASVNTVTLAGNLTPTLVNFSNSTKNYVLNSSTGNTLAGYTKLVKSGTGTLTFGGTANNTYTGGTVLSQGSLEFTNLGGAGTGALTIGDANTGAGNLSVMITARPASGTYLTAPIVVAAGTTGTVTIGTTAGVLTGTGYVGYNGIT
ncbi:MAG: hypothetical protein EBU72_13695, partial [Betaproteobacteria bacterium]|nr:hypothetical protein [Betaproteobacteria bacterium]